MKVFLDVETTGLDTSYCNLLQIAAICVDDNWEIVDNFMEYIKPHNRIPDNIVELTHITNEQVQFCRNEKQVLESFIDWFIGTGCNCIIAYNGKFDKRFLTDRTDRNYIDTNPFKLCDLIDPMKIVSDLIKEGKIVTRKTPTGRFSKRQEHVAESLGIEYNTLGAHNAMSDVLVLKDLYKKLLSMR